MDNRSESGERAAASGVPEAAPGPVTKVGGPPPIPDATQTALFLDLDGTLIEFAPTPDAVVVDPALPDLLRKLCANLNGALAIVSGRPLATIDNLLGLPQLAAVGQHGAEMRIDAAHVHRAAIEPHCLDAVRAVVRNHPALQNGVRVEDKGVALAFHYREFPGAEPLARELATAALAHAGAGFELLHGNCVIELKSARVDKGRALDALMQRAPFRGRRAWMLGDDYTDEPAFAVAQSLGGTGVIVGPTRATVAHAALPDVPAVHAWLRRLADATATR